MEKDKDKMLFRPPTHGVDVPWMNETSLTIAIYTSATSVDHLFDQQWCRL